MNKTATEVMRLTAGLGELAPIPQITRRYVLERVIRSRHPMAQLIMGEFRLTHNFLGHQLVLSFTAEEVSFVRADLRLRGIEDDLLTLNL